MRPHRNLLKPLLRPPRGFQELSLPLGIHQHPPLETPPEIHWRTPQERFRDPLPRTPLRPPPPLGPPLNPLGALLGPPLDPLGQWVLLRAEGAVVGGCGDSVPPISRPCPRSGWAARTGARHRQRPDPGEPAARGAGAAPGAAATAGAAGRPRPRRRAALLTTPDPLPGVPEPPGTPKSIVNYLETCWMLWELRLVLVCSGRGSRTPPPPPKKKTGYTRRNAWIPGFRLPRSHSRVSVPTFPSANSLRHFWVLPAGISPLPRQGESGGVAQTPSHRATDALGQSRGGGHGAVFPPAPARTCGLSPGQGFDYPGIFLSNPGVGQDPPPAQGSLCP